MSYMIDYTTLNFGNYSRNETDTGFTWIDGKKIYKKTFLFAQLGVPDLLGSVTGFDKLIRAEGGYHYTSENTTVWTTFPNRSIDVYIEAGTNNLYVMDYLRLSGSGWVTIYYTKTS